MKRIAIIALMVLLSIPMQARSIRYFTAQQAARTVAYLDSQNELMIYCGYDYEIETYVLVNEVWMERVNSSYYEIWLYGFDAYTGDEIYMPLDLQCIWLLGAGGRMYNAAQYLRFHASVRTPGFTWYIPPYNPYTRRPHSVGYVRTYHYNVHCHGWMPPAPPAHGWGPNTQPPLPPYYMRTPQQPAPAPTVKWTPGVDHPQVSNKPRETGTTSNTRTSSGGTSASGTARTGRTATTGTSNSGTTRGTGTTPTRTNTGTTTRTAGEGSTTRDASNSTSTSRTNTGTTTRQSGTTTGTTTRQSGTNTGTTTRQSGTNTGTATRQSGTNTGTTTRQSGTTTGTTTRQSGTTTGTTTRQSGTNNSSTSRTGTGSSSRSAATSGTTRTTNTQNRNNVSR